VAARDTGFNCLQPLGGMLWYRLGWDNGGRIVKTTDPYRRLIHDHGAADVRDYGNRSTRSHGPASRLMAGAAQGASL